MKQKRFQGIPLLNTNSCSWESLQLEMLRASLSRKLQVLFFLIYKEARFSPANSDFVYSKNCDNIVKTFFFKPEGDSFLNFGLTYGERVAKYKRNIIETCRPDYFKPCSEHGLKFHLINTLTRYKLKKQDLTLVS